ncbi:MAG: glycosyltransferase family 4 protein [Vicinamibacterales bacterium]
MKVVRIIARLNVGGPARHTVILGNGLAPLGFDTLLVHGRCGAGEASMEDLVDEASFRTRRIPALGRTVSPFDDLRAFVELTRLVFEERPDVIHTHTAKAGTLGRLAAVFYNLTRRRSHRALVVHTFHGHVFSGYFRPVVSTGVRTVERILARFTDRIVTISPRLREEIVEVHRVAASARTVVVPLGLELDRLFALGAATADARAAFGLPVDAFVVTFVGRFVPVKDLPTLVRGFASFAERCPRARLLLVGDGDLRPSLETLARNLGVGERVVFAGWQRDLTLVYGAADVVALTSVNEGTPVAVIEALAAGRPVVATRVGGVPDVVEDQVSGYLVEPGRPDELAAALERVHADPARAASMAGVGRERARSAFSAGRLVADVAALYETGLARMRAAR